MRRSVDGQDGPQGLAHEQHAELTEQLADLGEPPRRGIPATARQSRRRPDEPEKWPHGQSQRSVLTRSLRVPPLRSARRRMLARPLDLAGVPMPWPLSVMSRVTSSSCCTREMLTAVAWAWRAPCVRDRQFLIVRCDLRCHVLFINLYGNCYFSHKIVLYYTKSTGYFQGVLLSHKK